MCLSMLGLVVGFVKDMINKEYGLNEIQYIYIITQNCMFKTDAVRYTKHKRLFLIIPNYNTRYIYFKNNIIKQFINI